MLTALLIAASLTTAFAKSTCPGGGQLYGNPPPDGTEQGCKVPDSQGTLVRHGIWREWYTTGAKLKEGHYANGQRTGTWTWWWPNGKKRQQGYYRNNEPTGKWLYWNEHGKKLGKLNPEGDAEVAPAQNDAHPHMDQFDKSLKNAFQ